MNLREWRLQQAREALRDNTIRARLLAAQRAAAIQVELELGAIVRRQSFLANVRAAWRAAERDAEEGNSGL